MPAYTLPDVLKTLDGKTIESPRQWERVRRPEVLELYRAAVYGRSPGAPERMSFEFAPVDKMIFGGKATRKQVTIYLTGDRSGPKMDLLIYLPNNRKGPAPAFIGYNFYGNHTIAADPGIKLSESWMRDNKALGVVNNHATEAARAVQASRWPVETLIDRGYALATIYYGDIEPDFAQGWKLGVRGWMKADGTRRKTVDPVSTDALSGKTQPGDTGAPAEAKPDEWGAISAWAWGLSRAMDYMERDGDIDAKRVAVIGHSRLGKTSLWAGAEDQRFAIVISNDSGEGGAAIARRKFGETTAVINRSFPHWFNSNFKQYADRENEMPVDQHMLIALIAPRPVYIASAEKDLWADPRGEFLSGKHAEPVYALYGLKGLEVEDMPGINQPVGETIGYHIRSGVHDITQYDWEQYLNFADKHYGIKHPAPKPEKAPKIEPMAERP